MSYRQPHPPVFMACIFPSTNQAGRGRTPGLLVDSSPTQAWFALTRSGQVDGRAGRHRRWQRLLDAAGLLLLLPSPWCRR